MKKIMIFFLFAAAVFIFLLIKLLDSNPVSALSESKINNNNYYYPGEKIIYDVKLKGFYLGKAEFNYLSSTYLGSRKADLINFTTKVTNFYDKEEIYSDPETQMPFRVERDIRGWPGSEKITEIYDQENFTLTVKKKKGRKSSELVIKSDSPIHNAILLPFFVRSVPELYIGWSFKVNLGNNKFEVKLASIEDVKTWAGTFKAYYFNSEPEKFNIWISADSRRIPVKMRGLGNLGYTLLMKKYSRD